MRGNIGRIICGIAVCGVVCLVGPPQGGSPESGRSVLTPDQWRQDLDYLADTLEAVHPDLYARVERERFAGEVAKLRARIPRLSSAQITVALMQLVALVQDGHTSLDPVDPAGFGGWFPVRFYRFRDGIFITALANQHGAFAGARVTRIGKMEAEQAWQLAATVVGSDNEFGSQHRAPLFLSNATVLATLGVIDDAGRLQLEVQRPGRPAESLTLDTVEAEFDLSFQFWGEMWGPASSKVDYVTAFDGREPKGFYDTESDLPLHLRYRSAFWFTYLKDPKLFYLQVTYMGDSKNETFDAFSDRLWKAVDEAEIDLFVLDVRYNIGGDGSLVRGLVHEIIKRDEINRTGRLFTLVGRATFSAGVMLAAAMDQQTETVFVGEPMGAYYKHFGDGTSFGLPNSGLEVWVSTIYHQLDAYTGDDRVLPVQFPAQFSSTEYFGGHDPALQQVLASRTRPPLGRLFRDRGAEAALAEYEVRRKKFRGVDWWAPFSMDELNSLGNEFREADRWPDAMAAYRLNARRHPDHWRVWYSLGRAYAEQGKVDEAIEHYEKALAADPFNNLAPSQRAALAELRRQKSGAS